MPSRFDPPAGSESEPEFTPSHKPINGSKRYDVYCAQNGSPFLVYRGVRVKGMTPLLDQGEKFTRIGDFVELETEDGSSVYVARFSVLALCEHKVTFPGVLVSLK
jgi:hypothetical protein